MRPPGITVEEFIFQDNREELLPGEQVGSYVVPQMSYPRVASMFTVELGENPNENLSRQYQYVPLERTVLFPVVKEVIASLFLPAASIETVVGSGLTVPV